MLNDLFWWLKHEVNSFKAPVPEGRVILPSDMLEPGFTFDPKEVWFSYVRGRKDKRKIGDFSWRTDAMLFVNERAYHTFEDMFLKHGRAFPVRCDNKPAYIVLIDTIIDAIDLERSEFERQGLYPDLARDANRTFKVVLKEGFTSTADIFRTGPKPLKWIILVSDAFKTRYEQAGLTGLMFKDTRG